MFLIKTQKKKITLSKHKQRAIRIRTKTFTKGHYTQGHPNGLSYNFIDVCAMCFVRF